MFLSWVIFPSNAPLDLKPMDLRSAKFLSRTIAKVSGCEGLLLFMGIGFEWSYNGEKNLWSAACSKTSLQNTSYSSSNFSITVFFSKQDKKAIVNRLKNKSRIFKEGDYFIISENLHCSNYPYTPPRKNSPLALMDFPGKLHAASKSMAKSKEKRKKWDCSTP